MARKSTPKKNARRPSSKDQKPKEEGGRKEIRLMYNENDEVYKRVVANAEAEERTPAKEVKSFLKKNYKK